MQIATHLGKVHRHIPQDLDIHEIKVISKVITRGFTNITVWKPFEEDCLEYQQLQSSYHPQRCIKKFEKWSRQNDIMKPCPVFHPDFFASSCIIIWKTSRKTVMKSCLVKKQRGWINNFVFSFHKNNNLCAFYYFFTNQFKNDLNEYSIVGMSGNLSECSIFIWMKLKSTVAKGEASSIVDAWRLVNQSYERLFFWKVCESTSRTCQFGNLASATSHGRYSKVPHKCNHRFNGF